MRRAKYNSQGLFQPSRTFFFFINLSKLWCASSPGTSSIQVLNFSTWSKWRRCRETRPLVSRWFAFFWAISKWDAYMYQKHACSRLQDKNTGLWPFWMQSSWARWKKIWCFKLVWAHTQAEQKNNQVRLADAKASLAHTQACLAQTQPSLGT